jgi:MerR HTH family regulatory protein
MVLASEFCLYHNIEISFIHSLRDRALIETIVKESEIFLPISGLAHLEKIMRLHFDLEINLEGIETIAHLLARIQFMQGRIAELNNLLKAGDERYRNSA